MQTVADFAEANGKFREVTCTRSTCDGDGIVVHLDEVDSHLKPHILSSLYSENDVADLYLDKCQVGSFAKLGFRFCGVTSASGTDINPFSNPLWGCWAGNSFNKSKIIEIPPVEMN